MFLALFLFDKLVIDALPRDCDTFVRHGCNFVDLNRQWETTLYIGFYDWLRTSKNSVVGIRVILHDGRERLREVLPIRSYIDWVSPHIVEIMFSPNIVIDDSASVDQEFSVSRCLLSEDGTVALLFDASALDHSQVENILLVDNQSCE